MNERMDAADGEPENIMPSPTMSGGKSITTIKIGSRMSKLAHL